MRWDLEIILYGFCLVVGICAVVSMMLWCIAGVMSDMETIRKLREEDALREQRQRERGQP